MIESKTIILSCLIKLSMGEDTNAKPFRASHVYQQTGLSRSLIAHHLNVLTEKGILRKDGFYYTIVDMAKLWDAIKDSSGNKINGLLEREYGFLKSKDSMNKAVERLVLARTGKLSGHQELTEQYNKELDETLDALKGLKRYLNSKSMLQDKARRLIEQDWDEFWKNLGQSFQAAGYNESKIRMEVLENEGD